ncbi:MAG: phage tail tape measure protein [Rubellimicrobium sp.]|nr:phage tail tape measure protein [Rubellimicrobium sp.]
MSNPSDRIDALEADMAEASTMAATFSAELRGLRDEMGEAVRDLGALERGFSTGLRRAIDGVVFDSAKLSDSLRTVARSMVDTVYASAMRPVTDQLGGLLAQGLNGAVSGLMPFAEGGAFSQGRVMPFAKGGVVTQPTAFPMRGGTGLMGEAGPEAILPLARGPDGSLGVRAGGGGRAVHVTMNITTPDVGGFRRSQSQIAAEMGRALARGQRNR